MFPGRILGALSLIIAPILLIIGEYLRLDYYFYFPKQLEAYANHPGQMMASYSFFALGLILLWPGIIMLTQLIAFTKPKLAVWAGTITLFGLFLRLFHEGINWLAFMIVDVKGLDAATQVVKDTYGSFYVLAAFLIAIPIGYILLAIGAFKARILGLIPALLLGQWALHSNGVLKGSNWGSLEATAMFALALIPLGCVLLLRRTQSRP